MIHEVLVIEVTGGDGTAGRLLVEKPKRGLGVKFTLLLLGRAFEFITSDDQTHELRRATELVLPERDEE